MKINRCFDSHLHWLALGFPYLSLKGVKSISHISYTEEDFFSDWLWGFGLEIEPTLSDLDALLPDRPLCFSRYDGHAIWLNSKACEVLNLPKQSFWQEDEAAKIRSLISKKPQGDIKPFLKRASNKLNSYGITHIRDLGMDVLQWEAACSLFENSEINLAAESFLNLDHLDNLDELIKKATCYQSQTPDLMRCKGIKVFYDGTLSAQTAHLSLPYKDTSKQSKPLIEKERLVQVIEKVWSANLEIAIHAIGDQASYEILEASSCLWDKGLKGQLHLEHAQVLTEACIKKMNPQFVTCHMQPCHWLADKGFLKDTLDPKLYEGLFRWDWLESAGIPFYFGTDAPVDSLGIEANYRALKELAPLSKELSYYHTHPDQDWTPETYSQWRQLKGGRLQLDEVYFCGKKII